MTTSATRFAISHEGMRELQAGRAPWELLKELIQNAWDEAPDATLCTVTILPQMTSGRTIVTVEDNGPGFANIADAYTLLGNTAKRADPTKRGRFNLGEKEVISVAHWARIETKGNTVSFPEEGGREITKNRRRSGTKITLEMPWTEQQAHELTERLWIFRPTDCRLVVNSAEVPTRAPLRTHRAIMETVLQEGPGHPMRRTRRTTEIHILRPINEGESWIYEMGIPIQRIDTPYDLDIQQKVPTPPNRTEVPTRYLSVLYGETLNAMHQLMEEEAFGESWVKQALNEDRTSAEAVRSTIKARYGENVLLLSNDGESNLEAAEHGYELINRQSLSPKERDRFRTDGGMKTTREAFPTPDLSGPIPFPETKITKNFSAWLVDLATACELKATVEFIDNPRFPLSADCTPDSAEPTIRINVAHLPDGFLEPPYNRPEQLELALHEFGHAVARLGLKHGSRWGRGVAKASSMVASHLAAQKTAPATDPTALPVMTGNRHPARRR